MKRPFKRYGRKVIEFYLKSLLAEDPEIFSHVDLKRTVKKIEIRTYQLPLFYYLLFKYALWFFQWALPPFSLKFLPFTLLPLKKRIAYLEEWEGSKYDIKRNIHRLIKGMCVGNIMTEPRLLISLGHKKYIQERAQHEFSGGTRTCHIR